MKSLLLTQPEAKQGQNLTCVARVMKPQPYEGKCYWHVQCPPPLSHLTYARYKQEDITKLLNNSELYKPPLGVVGDRLYVKEEISIGFGGMGKELGTQFRYINNPEDKMRTVHVSYPYNHSYRSARDMPRYAARFFYEITGVRVEQRDGKWYWLYILKSIKGE